MRLDPETEKKLAGSLTAGSMVVLIPYLPYLLSDTYVASQESEYRYQEQALTGVVWLLQTSK